MINNNENKKVENIKKYGFGPGIFIINIIGIISLIFFIVIFKYVDDTSEYDMSESNKKRSFFTFNMNDLNTYGGSGNFGSVMGTIISMILGMYIEEIYLYMAWKNVIDYGYGKSLSQGWFGGAPQLIKSLLINYNNFNIKLYIYSIIISLLWILNLFIGPLYTLSCENMGNFSSKIKLEACGCKIIGFTLYKQSILGYSPISGIVLLSIIIFLGLIWYFLSSKYLWTNAMEEAIKLKINIPKNLYNHPENTIKDHNYNNCKYCEDHTNLIPKYLGTWYNWILAFTSIIFGLIFLIFGLLSTNKYSFIHEDNIFNKKMGIAPILSVCITLSHLPMNQAVIEIQKIKLYHYSLNYYDTLSKQISQLNIFTNLNTGIGYLYFSIILLQSISTCMIPIILTNLIVRILSLKYVTNLNNTYNNLIIGTTLIGTIIILIWGIFYWITWYLCKRI